MVEGCIIAFAEDVVVDEEETEVADVEHKEDEGDGSEDYVHVVVVELETF